MEIHKYLTIEKNDYIQRKQSVWNDYNKEIIMIYLESPIHYKLMFLDLFLSNILPRRPNRFHHVDN